MNDALRSLRWREAALLVLVLSLVVMLACTRSPEVACNVTETGTGSCADLLAAQLEQEQRFAVAVQIGDGADASDAGACAQLAARERVERNCFQNAAELCVEACRLHPCALREPTGECAAECVDKALAEEALARVVVRAADNPGFCSCAVCKDDDGSAVLCDDLWACP